MGVVARVVCEKSSSIVSSSRFIACHRRTQAFLGNEEGSKGVVREEGEGAKVSG